VSGYAGCSPAEHCHPTSQISLSKPAVLSVPLDGAVQATIKCTLVDPRGGTTGYYQAAFGDATITK
jgi:hypothetical protein